jgi:tetratricopeptide (TPR) repeat protein
VQLWQPLMAAWLDLGRHKITKPLIIEQFSVDVGKAAPLVNYHLALINEQAGFIDAATQNFKNAVEDPQNPPGLVIGPLLRFYAQHNKPDALQAIVKNYTKLHPEAANIQGIPVITTAKDGVAEVLYAMGGIMLGADITNDAVIYLQMTLYINPDFTDAALALGDAYVQLQQYDMANASYSKVKPDQQAYVKAQLEIAVNEDRLGKLDAALARLDKMEQHSTPAAAASLITRGDLLRTHMRYAEAIDAYTKAMGRVPELNVTYWPVLFARASCYERLGKWHDAEQDLQQALKLSPNQPDILNYLGYGWLEHGVHLAEARTMIETAFKASPNNAEIADSMGWSLYLQGHYEKAAEFIEKAVELLPGDPTVNDHLGDVYWRLGRKTEARYQWQRSLSFAPEQPLTNNLQRKIKDGLPAASTSDTVSDLSGDAPVKLATP